MDGWIPVPTKRVGSSLAVSTIGAVTTGFHFAHLVEELGEPVALLVGILPPMVISLGLIGGGLWLLRLDLPSWAFGRVLGWTIAGLVAVAITGWFISVDQSAHGTPLTDTVFMYANWVATGSLGGFVLGVYDARRVSVQQELRAERDRLAEKEHALARENERLESFASILSHDLRNPLNVARGNIALLGEESDADELETIDGALERMEALIDDVLTMAREGDEVIPGDLTEISLRTVATVAWDMVESTGGTLTVEDDITFLADDDRLLRIFENLYRNALEHAGTDVTVKVGPLPNRTGFFVEDDGVGIDTNEDVFAPGYSTDRNGTGLGLVIVESIATAHGWETTVTESDDGGARFEFRGVRTPERG